MTARDPSAPLPDRVEVVIVGGGIIGCSVAYHLTRRGTSEVLLVDQGTLTSGTTWHAAGLVSQLKSSHPLTRLATYSARLFEELEDETGQATGYRVPGSISVAADDERWEEILRGASLASTVGVDTEVLELDALRRRWPLLRTDDLVGALWIPRDGVTSPVDTTMALARGATNRGATIVESVAVTRVLVDGGRAVGVALEDGRQVEAETVVLCAGMWTRQLAATAGVDVPLQACEHFYLVTEPMDGVEPQLPTVRDPGNHTYLKSEGDKLMVGFFEPRGKVWRLDGIPRDFSFGTLPQDWDHIGPVFERAVHRVPALADAGIQLFFNGPEAFTPDGAYHLGESPQVDRCFVAAGFNSVGIQSAGGVGWALAEWIATGRPPLDLTSVDIRRTSSFQSNPGYLDQRIPESLGLLYAMHWPHRQYESARGVRLSPLHDRIDAAGAVFGEVAGWERPNWYAPAGTAREYRHSWGRPNWFDACAAECHATRTAVGLFDQSSFAKAWVRGPDAGAVLSWLSANDVVGDVGRAVYTQWCNDDGGIEADLTVTRTDDREFLVVTSAASQTRDWAALRRAARFRDVTIDDVTDDMAVLGVMGPRSRELLAGLVEVPLDDEDFPFAGAQWLQLAGANVLALRMSYVGELGWELYVPAADAGAVHDAIVAAGAPLGLRHAGYHAMDVLRLECGYRHWGHDITDQETPLEAGLGFAVAWDKVDPFRGRQALEAQRGKPLTTRLVQLRLDDAADVFLHHDEPVLRNGVLVGRTSSGVWGHTVGAALAMAWVELSAGVDVDWLAAGDWEVEVALRRHRATASLRPAVAPRVRGGPERSPTPATTVRP